mmetsp:Transcript_23969/g.72157  ORF Transcript_23969/g.72157 Transcript_23969/m.72157 type:complete len:211 (+) Transcript_23969:609-1241(+)
MGRGDAAADLAAVRLHLPHGARRGARRAAPRSRRARPVLRAFQRRHPRPRDDTRVWRDRPVRGGESEADGRDGDGPLRERGGVEVVAGAHDAERVLALPGGGAHVRRTRGEGRHDHGPARISAFIFSVTAAGGHGLHDRAHDARIAVRLRRARRAVLPPRGRGRRRPRGAGGRRSRSRRSRSARRSPKKHQRPRRSRSRTSTVRRPDSRR